MLDKLTQYLFQQRVVKKVNPRSIYIGTECVPNQKFKEMYFTGPFMKEAGVPDLIFEPHQEILFDKFVDLVKRELVLRAEDNRDRMFGVTELPHSEVDPFQYVPLIDVTNGSRLLYNTEIKEVSDLNYEVWEGMLSTDDRKLSHDTKRYCKLVYDPYDIQNFSAIMFEGTEILRANIYRPPTWRKEANPMPEECPEIIDNLLRHIFPNRETREFVLDWMYNALTTRNETYLVLNGAKGIGKGLLCTLLSMLVGREHYSLAPDSLLTNHFNAALDKKRVLVFDEFSVNKAEHTKLKRYINKYQNIENKGKDADTIREIYNSYLICNNAMTDMFLEYDDRRFSVPMMTSKDLQEVMSTEEITELDQRLQDDGELAREFGYWLFNRGALKHDAFAIWKSERFFQLVYHSLREWQKLIVDVVLTEDHSVLPVKKLKRMFSKDEKFAKFPRSSGKIQDFLTNYKHDGKTRLGKLVKDEDGDLVIEVSAKYSPKEDASCLF